MDLFIPDVPLAEKILRSALVYLFLLVAFRLAGKRQLGQATAFDLVVLLIVSNVVQNALIGNDNSVGGGLVGATVLLLMNAGVAWLTFTSKRAERLIESSPTIVISHGRVAWDNLRRERLSLPELRAALRRHGVTSVRQVRYAILEEDGDLSVIRRRPARAVRED